MENGNLTFEEIIEQANQILDFLKNLKTEVEQKQKENEALITLNNNLSKLIKALESHIETITHLLDQVSQLEPEKIATGTQRISAEISNLNKSSESLNQEIRSFFKNHSAEVSNSLNAFDEKLNSFRDYYNQRLDDFRNVLVQQITSSDSQFQKSLNELQNSISSFYDTTKSNFEQVHSQLEDSISDLNNVISKSTQQNQENLVKVNEDLQTRLGLISQRIQGFQDNINNTFDEKLNSFRNYYNQRLDDFRNVLVQQILQSDLKNQKNLNVIQNEISSFHNNTTSNFVLLNSKLDDSLSNFNNIISQSTKQNQENLAKVNEDLQTKLELISHNIQVFQDNFNENKIAGHKTIKNLRKLIIISLIVSSLALIISLINIFR
jgi:ElaB/YqjD/DUF883 family membrane-anchored ribosome-binding protein